MGTLDFFVSVITVLLPKPHLKHTRGLVTAFASWSGLTVTRGSHGTVSGFLGGTVVDFLCAGFFNLR